MSLLHEWLDRVTSDRGSAKALVYRDNYLSWRGLKHRVERRAQEFASMGIKKGDWVGLMLGNVPDFVILTLALAKLNAVIVPIDPTTASQEFELMLDAVPLRGLVTRPRGSEAQAQSEAARRQGRDERRKVDDAAENRRRLQGTLLMCSIYRRKPPKLDVTPEVVMFTSDSAGDPKAVVRTRANMDAIVTNVTKALGYSEETHVLTAVPLFHAYGWDFGFLPTMRHGGTMYLEEELSARRVSKILREQDVDIFPGLPTLYDGLAKLPTAKPLKRKGLKFLAAGSRLDAAVAEAFFQRYKVHLMSAYHTTETGPVSIDKTAKTPESAGKVIDGVQIKVTKPDGKKATGNAASILWVKSDTIAPLSIGPYEIPPSKARQIPVGGRDKTGWFRTGDLGRIDRSGRLFLKGREDDLVKVDGKRVALGEVEGCIETFPKVKQAQAMLISDPLAGPMVVARVVARSKCQAEEIIDHCARNLAPYKVPRRIEFCDRLT